MVVVHPKPTDEVIINPGTGWQLLVSQPPRAEMDELPLVSTYYYRSSWTEFEPAKGQYENSPAVRTIDAWLAEAQRHGRYVAIRVVPWNSRNPSYQRRSAQKVQGYDSPVPAYIFGEGAKGFPEPGDSGGWIPVFWDPIYLKYHRQLAAFLGRRYGGHPNLAYTDVPAGNYGEMNLTNTGSPALDDLSLWNQYGLTADSWNQMLRDLCDMYRDAFPHDLLVAARDYAHYAGGKEALSYAAGHGIGFRDDGLGMPYCGPGKTNPEYEQNWERVLCLYENGYGSWLDWNEEKDARAGVDEPQVRATLDWAVDHTHASIIMVGKGERGAESYRRFLPLVGDYGRRVGYRLVTDSAEWSAVVHPGGQLPISLAWRNTGNAPPYVDFAVEVSLVARSGESVCSGIVAPSDARTTTWLPGRPIALQAALSVPPGVPAGAYSVAVSVFEPGDSQPIRRRIRLGMEGEREGQYMLGDVRVE